MNIETELDPPALDYLRTCLAAGQTLIAAQSKLSLESGRIWAYLPSGLNPKSIQSLDWNLGLMIPVYKGKEDADAKIAGFISNYLSSNAKGYAIFQDINASPGEKWLPSEPYAFFTFGLEVYRFLGPENRDIDEIIATMRYGYSANSRLNVGVLATLQHSPAIRSGQAITLSTLQELSKNVEHIIVEAFDGDREIVWSKAHAG